MPHAPFCYSHRGFGVGRHEFKSWLPRQVVVRPQASDLSPLVPVVTSGCQQLPGHKAQCLDGRCQHSPAQGLGAGGQPRQPSFQCPIPVTLGSRLKGRANSSWVTLTDPGLGHRCFPFPGTSELRENSQMLWSQWSPWEFPETLVKIQVSRLPTDQTSQHLWSEA